MKIHQRTTWRNKTGQHQVYPLQYLIPDNLHDLRQAVRQAESSGHRIRAVGSGHSYSDIAITDGYLVDMRRLNRLLPMLQTPVRKDQPSTHLIEAEAGITIQRLNRLLDRRGLALLNMGAIDDQTLSGAIATGTHGAGRDLPAFPGMVRSMVLVAAGGEAYRLEPAQGITDADSYHHQDISLIQDDDVFYSALIHLGCMGIVHSYILEVRPSYWLYENRTVESWFEVRQKLQEGGMFEDYPIQLNGRVEKRPVCSVFIVVNPFRIKGDHSCMITRTFEVEEPHMLRFRDRTRALLSSVLSRIPLFFYLSLLLVNYLPRLLPAMLERSIRAVKDATYINKSYKVLFQGFEFVASQGQGAEFAYDRHQHHYLHAMEALFGKIEQLSEKFKWYPSSAPTLRFVKASRAYLSPEYGQDACYIGNPVLVRQKGAQLILNAYQDLHIKMGGKPHWGKITNRVDAEPELIRQWYPRFGIWQQVMRRFNPHGTFLNSFAERLQLDEPSQP